MCMTYNVHTNVRSNEKQCSCCVLSFLTCTGENTVVSATRTSVPWTHQDDHLSCGGRWSNLCQNTECRCSACRSFSQQSLYRACRSNSPLFCSMSDSTQITRLLLQQILKCLAVNVCLKDDSQVNYRRSNWGQTSLLQLPYRLLEEKGRLGSELSVSVCLSECQLEQLKERIKQSIKTLPRQKLYTWKSVLGCAIMGHDMSWYRGQLCEVLGGHVVVSLSHTQCWNDCNITLLSVT